VVSTRQLLFKTFYWLGFVPWDGHPLATSLQELVEGDGALAPGAAVNFARADVTLLSSGDEPAFDHNGKNPARHYLFARAS
jgi:hypothetical protein